VRYHNLFAIPGDLIARPAPRILEGARRVCEALDDARARLPLNPG
jgi:iron complex transport system substrate-binding protein